MMIERDKIETSRLDGVEVLGIGEGDRVCDPPKLSPHFEQFRDRKAVERRFRDVLAPPRCVIHLSSDITAAPGIFST